MTRAEQRALEAYPVNMTPNKLYIGLEDVGSGYVFDVSLLPNGFDEYIRKDTLLEKLEKAAASYKKRSDEGELVWQNMCGINKAINILNEM